MSSSVTLKLSGNLGERHRCFNALVHEAYEKNTSLSVQHHPEEAALDRLFKIDLASKQKNVDCIIHTLKDNDLLYVSRALKCLWLLEPQYSNIINPIFLENELFPHMTLPAVNKMRHWIQMHLRDSQRFNEFYQFYKERSFDIASNFFWHCSNEYVLNEFINVVDKITPKLLKRISEKVPEVTKIYYESLKGNNQSLLKYYLDNDSKFFANVKYLLKTDADVFFYVLENFFVRETFCSFNSAITKYIMKNHKSRFLLKPELYTAWFLDMDTLARCLSLEEIKNLVLMLARAEYLQSWFSYQKVEPLIKRLSKEERVIFKNLVFVDKAIGSTVKEWPYPIPTSPVLKTPQTNLFEDTIKDPYFILYSRDDGAMDFRAMLKKRKCGKFVVRSETLLDQLFDKYRFFNFKKTLLVLQKQLKAESSPQNREYMLLVLISKTGGKTEDVASLLDLLSQYKNEPVHIRAALIRSLVKRAFVWRLPNEQWARLLEFGHGLGLDGSPSEVNCNEGLHAVVLRDLLTEVKPSEAVWEMFVSKCFDKLHGYYLTVDERKCVRARLPALLLATVQSNPDKPHLSLLQSLLDTLEEYHIRFEELPGTVEAVIAAVKFTNSHIDGEASRSLLQCLYDAGTARKHLIKDYFEIIQTNASYVNALRHDISILDNTGNYEKLIEGEDFKHETFFRKLALYFTEKDGLAERYRSVLELRANTVPDKTLVRPLALLAGSTFPSIVKDFDAAPLKTPQRQLAAGLRSNAHVVRPGFDLESFGWRQAGAKAINNLVASCRLTDVERYLQACLIWRRTLRIALVLAKRVNKERDVFEVFASQRPGAALRAALRYFHREENGFDAEIWELVKSHILKLDHRQLRACIQFTDTYVPAVIKAEYCFLVYTACQQNLPAEEGQALSVIPDILHELNEQCVFDAIDSFLNNYFTDYLKLKVTIGNNAELIGLYIEIIAKFLVLSTSEAMLEERYRRVALPFLNQLELFWKQIASDEVPIEEFLDSFIFYLRYNKVYFDVKYASCLPLFEKITEWMHRILPIEKWFDKYVTVHLTMIYLKTVRYCLKQNFALFLEKTIEGACMLGSVFGKFLGNEINELTQNYFPTIIEIYGSELRKYFSVYYKHDDSIIKFKMGILNGLLSIKSIAACLLAKYIFMYFRNQLNSEYVKDILNKFKESEIVELRFEIDSTDPSPKSGWRPALEIDNY